VLLATVLFAVAPAAAAKEGGVRTRRVPDGGIHPQVATDARGRLHLAYFKGDPKEGDVYYVRSEDGGSTFTKAIRVNSQPGSVIIAGTVRGPHLAVGRDDRVHVAWMGSSKAEPRIAGRLAPMLYARMNDARDGFEPERNVIHRHPGLDGGGSIAADPEGNVYVAWHAPADRSKGHDEDGRYVWVARSKDDGKTFSPETQANSRPTGVCGCCGMRIFAADKGRVFIAYRTATKVVNRDLHVLASNDYGRTFEVAAADPWEIGKCVMSTAAFAQAQGGNVLAAWETREQIRFARVGGDVKARDVLSAPGRGENRKHPSIAVNARGEFLLAWTEGTGWAKGGSVAWQVFDEKGKPVAGREGRASGLPAWGVPAAVAMPDGSFTLVF
jgi:hypothetical protein